MNPFLAYRGAADLDLPPQRQRVSMSTASAGGRVDDALVLSVPVIGTTTVDGRKVRTVNYTHKRRKTIPLTHIFVSLT